MATWHQQQNPVQYWHETLYTVVMDPPNQLCSFYRCKTRTEAERYLTNSKEKHAYIINPACKPK